MNDIQKARDLLAKWRSESALTDYQPWSMRSDYPDEARVLGADKDDVASPGDYAGSAAWFTAKTARLIVGTGGNPRPARRDRRNAGPRRRFSTSAATKVAGTTTWRASPPRSSQPTNGCSSDSRP